MARVINRGFAKRNDPIYTGGPQVFTPGAFRPKQPAKEPESERRIDAETTSDAGSASSAEKPQP